MPLTLRQQRVCVERLVVVLSALGLSQAAFGAPQVTNRAAASPRAPVNHSTLADRVAKLVADGVATLAANDLAHAQQLFEQAFRLRPAPELLYQLGRVAQAQGQTVVAADFYRRYLESGTPSTDEPTNEALRKRISELPTSVSEVTIAGSGGALLSVDGRLTGVLPLSRPLLLGAGPHRYRLEMRGVSSESDPLTIPDGRPAELHLTAGTSASLIAVLTLNSLALLAVEFGSLSDDQKKQVEESIATAARNEHTLILAPDKHRELLASESPRCLSDVPCLDRLTRKAEVRLLLRFAYRPAAAQPPAPLGALVVEAELIDLVSGLRAAHLQENASVDGVGNATLGLTRRLFQAALTRPRGTLHIESNPPAATVSLEGRVLGQTPLERVTLSGSHKITIEKAGFEPYESTLSVAAGATAQISAELLPTALPPPIAMRTIPGESKGSRITRWVLGGLGLGVGLTLTGLGASALAQNGACGDRPAPNQDAPCELLYNTGTVGGALLGTGIGLSVGGALLMFIPGRSPRQVPASPAPK